METNKPRWLSTGYLKSHPEGEVSPERGVIERVSVTTEGEASGHGVHLDEAFIDTVVEKGNEKKAGLKARFGHPNMCSTALGTFIGRFKNFTKETVTRDDGSEACRAVADLFMSNSAKDTPNGNLYDYVFSLADSEADMFGTSIVFTPGEEYHKTKDGRNVHHQWGKDKEGNQIFDAEGQRVQLGWVDDEGNKVDEDDVLPKVYIECEALHACDAVDDPAANDGLFSAFGQETVAGQVTEFFDLHPQVWDAVTANPEIMSAIVQYGDKVDEFINRYRQYRQQSQQEREMSNSAETKVATPEAEHKPAPELETDLTTAEPVTETPETPEVAETPKETKPEEQHEQQPEEEDPRAEFKRMVESFGADIASKVYAEGGTFEDAKDAAFAALKADNESLKAKLAEITPEGGKPSEFAATDEKKSKKLFNTNK